jgi:hypothetical protein
MDALYDEIEQGLHGHDAAGHALEVAPGHGNQDAVAQLDALDKGDQVAVLPAALGAVAHGGGQIWADAVVVAQARGVPAS